MLIWVYLVYRLYIPPAWGRWVGEGASIVQINVTPYTVNVASFTTIKAC